MQSIDSEVKRRKRARSYSDSNGFINDFNISGTLKTIDLTNNRIELLLSRKSQDYAIEIEIEPSRMPSKFRTGDLVTCTGFVRGENDENDGWRIRFCGREIVAASLTDLGDDALDDLIRRMELPYSVKNAERLATPQYRRRKAARRNGNYVGLSGFVENMKFYPGAAHDDGSKGSDSVKMLIRQFDNVKLSVMVELNGREARETYRGIARLSMKGFPFIRFHGEAYVKVRDVTTESLVFDDQGEPVLDEQGGQLTEEKTVKVITQSIKAIASVGVGQPSHCRQPKTVTDENGEEITEYPYPWAEVYRERAEKIAERIQKRA